MTLKTVMEALTGRAQPSTINDLPQLFEDAKPLIFTNFPIFNESHRPILENLILGHYLTREISITPVQRWKFALNQKLNEIMPYYNQLYKSFGSDYDPFSDTNYTREIQTNKTVTMEKGTQDTTVSTNETEVNGTFTPGTTTVETHADTPQSNLANFLNDSYMSSADKSTMTGSDTTNNKTETGASGTLTRSGQDKDTEDNHVVESVKGKRGGLSYIELMAKYKDAILNIDQMIIEELEELFFMIL